MDVRVRHIGRKGINRKTFYPENPVLLPAICTCVLVHSLTRVSRSEPGYTAATCRNNSPIASPRRGPEKCEKRKDLGFNIE